MDIRRGLVSEVVWGVGGHLPNSKLSLTLMHILNLKAELGASGLPAGGWLIGSGTSNKRHLGTLMAGELVQMGTDSSTLKQTPSERFPGVGSLCPVIPAGVCVHCKLGGSLHLS